MCILDISAAKIFWMRSITGKFTYLDIMYYSREDSNNFLWPSILPSFPPLYVVSSQVSKFRIWNMGRFLQINSSKTTPSRLIFFYCHQLLVKRSIIFIITEFCVLAHHNEKLGYFRTVVNTFILYKQF